MSKLRQICTAGIPRVFGMIHLQALPGTPRNTKTVNEIGDIALREAETYIGNGVHGLIIENMHDIPYCKSDSITSEVISTMSVIASRIRSCHTTVPIGVQILAGANKQALAVALAADLDFIRAECYVFSHVADEGWMDGCAGELMRYRKQIDAENISVITDIKKKHSSHTVTSDISLVETAQAAQFFLADGVIITGSSTGVAAQPQEITDVKSSIVIPVFVGSGVTTSNLHEYRSADGVIVGSHFKRGGIWNNELDVNVIRSFMRRIEEIMS